MLVVNMDVVDRHEESAVAAPRMLQLCQMVSEANADASLALCTCNDLQWLQMHSVRRLWAVSYTRKSSELSLDLPAMHDRPSSKGTKIVACSTSSHAPRTAHPNGHACALCTKLPT